MELTVRPSRPEGCLSDLQLDDWLAGELAGEARAATARHLAGCAPCRDRLATLEAGQRAFLAAPPPLRLPPAGPRDRRRRWQVAVPVGAAALAALLLFVVPGRWTPGPGSPPGREDGVRTKGGEGLGFFVKHGDAIRRGRSGETVAPEDTIRFTYRARRTIHLAILSRDPVGAVGVYYPAPEATQAAVLPAAEDAPLPVATRLDGTLGTETIWGLFCRDSAPLAPLREALAAAPEAPRWPAGCDAVKVQLEKRSAP